MKKINKRKQNKFKIILICLLLIIVGFFSYNKIQQVVKEKEEHNKLVQKERARKEAERKEREKWQQVFLEDDKEYPVIKQDTNDKYLGEGQKKVKHKDEYFTTFTTLDDHKKTYIEYKQNGPTPWADNPYWGEVMETSGCGITAMSVLLSGYGFDDTPEDLRKKYYPYMDYSKLSEELKKNYNIEATNFYFDSQSFSKNKILNHLYTNRPVIVCLWNKLENRWTTRSHFILLLAATDDGMVYVSNPNGLLDSSRSSGWYSVDEVIPYIAKVMYVTSY